MIRCFTTSDGYEVIQKTCAERPPAQKLIEGVESDVEVVKKRVKRSYANDDLGVSISAL